MAQARKPQKRPAALKKGDLIGIFAPSSYIEKKKLDVAVKFLEGKGFKVFVHPQTYQQFNQSAGTNAEKVAAFHDLLRDKNVKAIFAAGGGNRALHILDDIDYKLVGKNPKIIMGFSDVTAILNAVTARTGIVTFHGPVATWLPGQSKEMSDFNFKLLAGKTPAYPMKDARVLREGMAEGKMVGGCLSLFYLLAQTKDCPPLKDAILFIEDVGEEYSRIDRMLAQLVRTGVMDKIGAIVCGSFSDLRDTGRKPYGFTLEQLVLEHAGNRDIPIIMDAPFGHGNALYAMPVGGKAILSAKKGKVTLKLAGPAVKP